MFVGRKKELAELTADSKKSGIPVVVLYGREGVGKTTLAREFARERNCVYYLGRELSKEEQKRYFQEVLEQVAELVNKAVRAALSATATEAAKATKAAEKICFIVDEFDVMEKAYKDFFCGTGCVCIGVGVGGPRDAPSHQLVDAVGGKSDGGRYGDFCRPRSSGHEAERIYVFGNGKPVSGEHDRGMYYDLQHFGRRAGVSRSMESVGNGERKYHPPHASARRAAAKRGGPISQDEFAGTAVL